MSLEEDDAYNAMLLREALNKGINLFDTADLYQKGQNEVTVGKAFKGMRQQVLIATKVGNQWRQDGSGWDWNPRKEYILQAVEGSLRRLQTDYLDLYQLHGGTIDDPIDETIEAFEILKQQGKIREYGISSIRPNVIREYVKQSGLVSVMMQYSLLDRRPEESCLDLLYTHKISVLVRGSLAKGLLVNKPAVPYLDYTAAEVQHAAKAISLLADKSRNVTQVALQFVLDHPAVATAVVGMRTREHLLDILTEEKQGLAREERQQLQRASRISTYTEHR